MKRIILVAIVFAFVGLTNSYGQVGGHFATQYDISFGTGNLGEYISQPSFRGASIQYRASLSGQFLLGIDAGWNVFYEEKPYDSYTSGTQTLSGKQYRIQNQVPLLVSADYIITPDKAVQPYVGLGIGTMYSERVTEMGYYYIEENPWHFALKPEVGLMYEVGYNTKFKLAAKYYTGFAAGELETQGYFTISTGFAFEF